ncbi:MAG: hypothetical protein ACK5P7_06825 [Bdellovibrio sp.]
MATWMLLSIIGTLSGHHFCNHAHTLRVISSQTLARVQLFIVPTVVCLSFWARENLFRAFLFLIFLIFSPPFLMWMNHITRRKRFASLHLPFTDELLLKMRSGKSLREGLRELSHQKNFQVSRDLTELSPLLVMQGQNSEMHLLPEAQELLKELLKWDRTQVKTIEKLKAYRFQIRQVEKFRQKSRQVTEQVKAQAILCAVLYLSLLIWTGIRSPSDLFSGAVMISIGLFFCGLCALVWVGRSFKWKT